MTKELIERLYASDVASALTNEAARAIEALQARVAELETACDLARTAANFLSAERDIIAAELAAALAQEPAELSLNIIRKWPDGFQKRLDHVWKDVDGFIPNVKLYDLQRTLAEFGFTMKVYEQAAQPAQVPAWQDISTAPKDGSTVLLYGQWAGEINGVNTTASIDLGRWSNGTSDFPGTDWWQLITGDAYACWMIASHWMPLPELPAAPEVK